MLPGEKRSSWGDSGPEGPGLVGAGASWELFLAAFSSEIQWESHQSAAFLVAEGMGERKLPDRLIFLVPFGHPLLPSTLVPTLLSPQPSPPCHHPVSFLACASFLGPLPFSSGESVILNLEDGKSALGAGQKMTTEPTLHAPRQSLGLSELGTCLWSQLLPTPSESLGFVMISTR